jgi:hypothetical protein
MRFLASHGGQAPTGAFTQAAVDGTHNASFQVGAGYSQFGFSVNYRESHAFPVHTPNFLAPSGAFTQSAVDGTHNASLQAGAGYWDYYYLLNDYPIWYRTLTAILRLIGFFYARAHGVYLFPMTAGLSFAGLIQRKLFRFFTAAQSFSGLFRKGRIFLASLAFSAAFLSVHTYRRTFTALLSLRSEFLTHFHSTYAFLLTSALAFSGFMQRTQGKFFSAFAYFNILPPTSVTGLKFWVKADSITANDGDLISTWSDQSGNGFDFTGSGTARPTYKVGILNAKPILRFNGSTTVLKNTVINVPQPNTVIIVAKSNSATGHYGMFFEATQSSPRQFIGLNSGGGQLLIYAGNSVLDSTNHYDAFHIFTAVISGSLANGYVDGTQTITSQNTGSSAVQGVEIGGQDWATNFLDGDVAEELLYTHALSDAERQSVEAYLSTKYGIAVAAGVGLPSLTKLTTRILSAAASFIGSVSTVMGHVFFQVMTAAQSFIGSFSTVYHHPFSHLMTAVLSFSGTALITHIYNRLLSATLSFIGFVQTFHPTYLKALSAALAFVGFFQRGPFFKLFRDSLNFNQVPQTIPDLWMWLDASQQNYNDGDLVNTWRDSSGRSLHATASGTQRPTFKTNILNGKSVMRFDGIANGMFTPPLNLPMPDTLIAVAKCNSTATGGYWFYGASGGGPNYQEMYLSSGNGVFAIGVNGNAQWVDFSANRSGAFHIFTATYGGSPSFFINGYVDGTKPMAAVALNTEVDFNDGTSIGQLDSVAAWTAGDIAELIAYGHELTSTELGLIHGYLGMKYGIPTRGADPSLTKLTSRILSAVASFFTFFHIPGFTAMDLGSTLSFAGNWIGHKIGTTYLALSGALSFAGRIQKRATKLFSAAFSFVGAIAEFYEHFQVVFRSTLSFVSDWAYAWKNKGLQSTLSFVSHTMVLYKIPRQKMWSATLRFIGDFSTSPTVGQFIRVTLRSALRFSHFFYTMPAFILFEASLRFQSTLNNFWNRMRALFLVIASTDSTERVAYDGQQEAMSNHFISNNQVIGTSPVLVDFLDLPAGPIPTCFIKNTDTVFMVRIAGDNLFTKFPQTIPPGMGVFISPQDLNVWAMAVGGPVTIQIIAG